MTPTDVNDTSTRRMPRISIAIATFNAEQHLGRCLDSIRQQTYVDREVIVADGGSTDGTLDIIRANGDLIAHWFSASDRGIYDAWNKALRFVTGQWVVFRGADDFFWDRGAVARAARHLARATSDQLIAYGRAVCVDERGNWAGIIGADWPACRRRFFHQMNLPHPATFHHIEAFKRHGEFDDSFRIAGDWEFLLRVLKTTDAFFIPEGIIAGVRTGGVSRRKNIQTVVESLKARKKNKLPGLPFLLWRHLAVCALSNMRHRAAGAFLGHRIVDRAVARRRRARSVLLEREIASYAGTEAPL